jgi:hypothetical protein
VLAGFAPRLLVAVIAKSQITIRGCWWGILPGQLHSAPLYEGARFFSTGPIHPAAQHHPPLGRTTSMADHNIRKNRDSIICIQLNSLINFKSFPYVGVAQPLQQVSMFLVFGGQCSKKTSSFVGSPPRLTVVRCFTWCKPAK